MGGREDSVLGRGMARGQSWGPVGIEHTWTKVCPETQTHTPRTPSRTQAGGRAHRPVWQADPLVYPYISQSLGRVLEEGVLYLKIEARWSFRPENMLCLHQKIKSSKPTSVHAVLIYARLVAARGLEAEVPRPPSKGLPGLGGPSWPRKGKRPQPHCLPPGPPPRTSAGRTKQAGLSAVAAVSHPAL